jgi:hypothetical protein
LNKLPINRNEVAVGFKRQRKTVAAQFTPNVRGSQEVSLARSGDTGRGADIQGLSPVDRKNRSGVRPNSFADFLKNIPRNFGEAYWNRNFWIHGMPKCYRKRAPVGEDRGSCQEESLQGKPSGLARIAKTATYAPSEAIDQTTGRNPPASTSTTGSAFRLGGFGAAVVPTGR